MDSLDDRPARTSGEFRAAELSWELERVRDALRTLPEHQQRVLIGVIVEGRKPAEIAAELGRSPAGIYNLSLRAKKALRRALLEQVLGHHADAMCRTAAQDLPDHLLDDVDDPRMHSVGLTHIRGCDRCRRAWRRYTGLSGALGITTLLVLSQSMLPAAPASAAALGATAPVAGGATAGAAAPTTAGAAATGGFTGFLARLGAVKATGLGVGVLLLLGGGAVAAVQALGGADPAERVDVRAAPGESSVDAEGVDFSVQAQAVSDGSYSISFDFEAADTTVEDWQLRIDLTDATLRDAPADFDCTTTAGATRCEAVEASDGSGSFTVDTQSEQAVYTLELVASTDDRRRITGSATGRLGVAPEAER